MTAEEVVADAVERFHPRVALACSFQKEETVLLEMLFAAEPSARVFALDTRVLFEETYDHWKAVEARYDTKVEKGRLFLGALYAMDNSLHKHKLKAPGQPVTGLLSFLYPPAPQ